MGCGNIEIQDGKQKEDKQLIVIDTRSMVLL